jgi:hypothetical protein
LPIALLLLANVGLKAAGFASRSKVDYVSSSNFRGELEPPVPGAGATHLYVQSLTFLAL